MFYLNTWSIALLEIRHDTFECKIQDKKKHQLSHRDSVLSGHQIHTPIRNLAQTLSYVRFNMKDTPRDQSYVRWTLKVIYMISRGVFFTWTYDEGYCAKVEQRVMYQQLTQNRLYTACRRYPLPGGVPTTKASDRPTHKRLISNDLHQKSQEQSVVDPWKLLYILIASQRGIDKVCTRLLSVITASEMICETTR